MALTALTKAALRVRIYDVYGEASGGADFTGTLVYTALQEAVQEFALRTDCVVGSARRPRPDVTGGNEALVTIPTGMYRVDKVAYLHVAKTTTAWSVLEKTTERALVLREGSTWMQDSETTSGTAPNYHRWYVKDSNQIGFYPPNMSATAGSALLWGPMVPDLMTAAGSCEISPEWCPGIIYIACRKLAEHDADSDAEGKRAADFEAKAQGYVNLASAQKVT